MPTAPRDEPRTPRAVPGLSVPALVKRHLLDVDEGGQLITVTHQPQGPVGYMVEPDGELDIIAVDLQGGNVITSAVHVRFGQMLIVMSGPAVTEIVLHDGFEEAEAYREYAKANSHQHEQLFTDQLEEQHEIGEGDVPNTAIRQRD